MDKIPAIVLVIGAAIAWLGLAVAIILRIRRRRSGSSLVRSEAPAEALAYRHGRPRRIVIGHTPARHRRLRVRKMPGP